MSTIVVKDAIDWILQKYSDIRDIDKLISRLKNRKKGPYLFNILWKVEFLTNGGKYINDENLTNSIFTFSDTEIELQKDIGEFTKEELQCCFETSNLKFNTLKPVCSKLRLYFDFLRINNYCDVRVNDNDISTILNKANKNVFESNIIHGYLHSKDEYYELLNSCINARDKAAIALAFERFTGLEIMKMKISDFNEYNRTILGRRVSIETCAFVKQAIEQTRYILTKEKLSKHGAKDKDLIDKDYIIKRIDTGTASKQDRSTTSAHLIAAIIRDVRSKVKKHSLMINTIVTSRDIIDYIEMAKELKRDLNYKEIKDLLSSGDRQVTDYSCTIFVKTMKLIGELSGKSQSYFEYMEKISINSIKKQESNSDENEKTQQQGETRIIWIPRKSSNITQINERRKARGDIGEEEVLSRLHSLFGEKSAELVDDWCGFDIIFKGKYKKDEKAIEVKTLYDLDKKFFLSNNQIEKANKYKSKYCILLVIKSPIDTIGSIKVIENPYESLCLREVKFEVLQDSLCEYKIEEVSLNIKANKKHLLKDFNELFSNL